MGTIYKRGAVFWVQYYRNGKAYRESAKSEKESDAVKLLKRREGEIAQGRIPGIVFDKVRFDELVKDFISDYTVNERKSLVRAERSVKHLKESFEGMKVTNISTPLINQYIEKRLEEKAAHASINRELAALKRILNLGARQTPPKVDRVPYIPMLKENNTRKGFFEHSDFEALQKNLPDYLRPFTLFAYKTGWRFSEIANLKWKEVDLMQRTARLEAGQTKNDGGRTVYLDDELHTVFLALQAARKTREIISPYVFVNEAGTNRIYEIRWAWKRACKNAKIGGRLFHDFRRTAVRNMIRAGIPERVAMMISGHKTRSVFDRYNIVSETDLKLAAEKQQIYLEEQHRHKISTVAVLNEKGAQAGKPQPPDITGAWGGSRTPTALSTEGF